MSSSRPQKGYFAEKLRGTWGRLRRKSRGLQDPKVNTGANAPKQLSSRPISAEPDLQPAVSSASCAALDLSPDAFETSPANDDATIRSETTCSVANTAHHAMNPGHSVDDPATCNDDEMTIPSTDIWSTAYREAVDSLGQDIDHAILQGKNIAELFKKLEEIDKEKTQESAFLRGVKYLNSLQVPLERFKLALDIAIPLASAQPAASMALGVVKGVTAIAISFSTADVEFAKQIGEMLRQLAYIDECDALDQRDEGPNIHKALVSVYRKLLEFYNAAYEILSRKGARLVIKMVLETDRLPNIVTDFLQHTDFLHRLVQTATINIVNDLRDMLIDQDIARWLGAEKIMRQREHHAAQQDIRAEQACEFLLDNAEFIKWNEAAKPQQLVILGNLGFGKTIAMAFLIDELRRQHEDFLLRPKVCYHYCKDDETGEAVYILSNLILSFLEQFESLKKPFWNWYRQARASGIDPASSFKKLEEWFHGATKRLDRPLVLAIDGLDECHSVSRITLLQSLKTATQTTPRLKILLSCRPQEEIITQITGMATITLKADISRDRIIVEKEVQRQLSYLPEELKALVTDTLSALAQGSGIWVKMTVDLIRRQRIRAHKPIQAFLSQLPLPAQLSELYDKLFSRCTADDTENQRLATAALGILAVSRRPLSILELAWAVALGSAQEAVSTVDTLEELVDHLRVIDLIQPFVVNIDFRDTKKHQVLLVHQSVKEFVIRNLVSVREDRASSPVPPSLFANAAAVQQCYQQEVMKLEAYLLNVCVQYLLLSDVDRIELYLAMEELPLGVDLFGDVDDRNSYDRYCTWEAWEADMEHYDPIGQGFGELFVYAACHWVEHFGAVSNESLLPDMTSIEKLCQAGSTRLHNWTKQNCRPGCTIQPRYEFDGSLYDPLSITCLYGSETMLQRMLGKSDLDSDHFLPDSAMGAATQILQWGDLSRLRLLFGSNIGYHLHNYEFFQRIIKQWANSPLDKNRDGWNVAFNLIDDMLDIMVRDQWSNKLLDLAASRKCTPIIDRVMDRARQRPELKVELSKWSQP